MFYQNRDWSFRILDIFYFERKKRDVFESGRTFTGLSYRLKGSSTFYAGNQQYRAENGAVIFIPEGCAYRHKTDTAEQVIILHLESAGKVGNSVEMEAQAEELEPLFRKLLEVWEDGGASSYNRCMSILYTIFGELQHKKEQDAPPVPASIAPGIEILRRNFRDPHLTVAALANACFVSEVYFRRVYRVYSGESPLQTILNLRFRYARNLLRSGYYTPKQAAELSGFSDVKYFRTAFKKRYGETPSEYIAREQNCDNVTEKNGHGWYTTEKLSR